MTNNKGQKGKIPPSKGGVCLTITYTKRITSDEKSSSGARQRLSRELIRSIPNAARRAALISPRTTETHAAARGQTQSTATLETSHSGPEAGPRQSSRSAQTEKHTRAVSGQRSWRFSRRVSGAAQNESGRRQTANSRTRVQSLANRCLRLR